MNSEAGKNGMDPIILVLSMLRQILIAFADQPEQRPRMKILKPSRDEMGKVVANSRLKTAMVRFIRRASDRAIVIGSYVLFYRENTEDLGRVLFINFL